MSLEGADRLIRRLQLLPGLASREVVGAIKDAAQSLRDDAVTKINGGARSGRVFGGRRSSAPGEYPKTLTGQLAASIFTRLEGLSASVGTALDYGKYLEFGTSKLSARPWLRPSFLVVLPKARDKIYSAMAKAIKVA